jgi:hypothetical protein
MMSASSEDDEDDE